MKLSMTFLVTVFAATLMMGVASAGPIMKMLEEKKASQAAAGSSKGGSPSGQTSSSSNAAMADKNSSKFETAKVKCKELGNQEGSDKYDRCVMTLME
jgi:hypothetical protein